MAPHPLVGKPAPALTLPNYDGSSFEFVPGAGGVPTALLFYPQSGSYGCTAQACQFRDALVDKEPFKDSKIQVIGISPDSVEKQKQFVEKQKLTFPILSDADGQAREKYSVGKGMMGLTGSARVSFIIDSKGVVRDSLDATMNYLAHLKFVEKWLDILEKEGTQESAVASPAVEA